ncbi:unnamed protein product [Prorocentrum cordatum]|uniref:Uncharacterized protein n=1 Tax=Prorocentrum cordatum TaxID=2364126 RepID=A0ABN9XAG9_9DINO|nr:unnamed protein product [Polarella glacialis]
MAGDVGSLYGLLRKAKPLWSGEELRKVHEKLNRVDIRDAEALGRAVYDGKLNAALASAGERRLKSSTVTQLKILVRDIHRNKQAELECASIVGRRRCYCGVCQYCAQAHEPHPLQHSKSQGALPKALSVWPTVPAKAAPSRSPHARRPPAFGGAGAPPSALRRTGEAIAAGAVALGQRSAAERVSMLGKQLRLATEGLAKASQEASSGSRHTLADGAEWDARRQTSQAAGGRAPGRPSLQPTNSAMPLPAVDESAAYAAQSMPQLRRSQIFSKKRVSVIDQVHTAKEDDDAPARPASAWEDTLPGRLAMPQQVGERAAQPTTAPREGSAAQMDNVHDDISAWTVDADGPSRDLSTAGSALDPWSADAPARSSVRRVLQQSVEDRRGTAAPPGAAAAQAQLGADAAAARVSEAAGSSPSSGPRSPSSTGRARAAGAGQGFQSSLSPVASSAPSLSPIGEAAELARGPRRDREAMRNSQHSEVTLSSAVRTPLRPPRGEELAPVAGKSDRRTRMIRAYG